MQVPVIERAMSQRSPLGGWQLSGYVRFIGGFGEWVTTEVSDLQLRDLEDAGEHAYVALQRAVDARAAELVAVL